MYAHSLLDRLELALDNRHMLTGSSNVDHNTKTSKLHSHGRKCTFAISTELDTIEVSAYGCINERSDAFVCSDDSSGSILYSSEVILALGRHHEVVHMQYNRDLVTALPDLVEHTSVVGVLNEAIFSQLAHQIVVP